MGEPLKKYDVIKAICKASGLDEFAIKNSRLQQAAFARNCLYRFYHENGYTQVQIAEMFKMSRPNISYHLQNFDTYYKQMPEFKAMYDTLIEEYNGSKNQRQPRLCRCRLDD